MTDTKLKRPTSIEEMIEMFERNSDSQDSEKGLAFQPRPTDIIVTPYAKSGTTWLQQITHGLRTRGSMDFDEITAVTPWIEVAHRIGWDLEAEQVANPRLYKSHLSWHDVPKGARYIVSVRNYHEMHVSLYRFFEGWFFEPETITLDDFITWRCNRDEMGEKGYWHHLTSWWQQRHNDNVLLLCYEDMKADLPSTIKRVAEFMQIDLDDELFEIVLRQSSREFMLEHKYHFDDKYMHDDMIKTKSLPPAISSHKVTAGADHPRYHLSDETRTYLDSIWHEQITSTFGFATYEDFHAELSNLYSSSEGRTT